MRTLALTLVFGLIAACGCEESGPGPSASEAGPLFFDTGSESDDESEATEENDACSGIIGCPCHDTGLCLEGTCVQGVCA